jgi:hypothetical protein
MYSSFVGVEPDLVVLAFQMNLMHLLLFLELQERSQ